MIRYPGRLAHQTPAWVETGSTFHVRISVDRRNPVDLTSANIGSSLLTSARLYHDRGRWGCRLFLLMPDHLHALIQFPGDQDMRSIVGAWKGYHTKTLRISWQVNYFDHRIRDRRELAEKATYIRLNPVRKKLCVSEADWPWVITCV